MARAIWATFAIVACCVPLAEAVAAQVHFDERATLIHARHALHVADPSEPVSCPQVSSGGKTGVCD